MVGTTQLQWLETVVAELAALKTTIAEQSEMVQSSLQQLTEGFLKHQEEQQRFRAEISAQIAKINPQNKEEFEGPCVAGGWPPDEGFVGPWRFKIIETLKEVREKFRVNQENFQENLKRVVKGRPAGEIGTVGDGGLGGGSSGPRGGNSGGGTSVRQLSREAWEKILEMERYRGRLAASFFFGGESFLDEKGNEILQNNLMEFVKEMQESGPTHYSTYSKPNKFYQLQELVNSYPKPTFSPNPSFKNPKGPIRQYFSDLLSIWDLIEVGLSNFKPIFLVSHCQTHYPILHPKFQPNPPISDPQNSSPPYKGPSQQPNLSHYFQDPPTYSQTRNPPPKNYPGPRNFQPSFYSSSTTVFSPSISVFPPWGQGGTLGGWYC